MFGSGSKRPATKPRTTCGITRRPLTAALATLTAAVGVGTAPPAGARG